MKSLLAVLLLSLSVCWIVGCKGGQSDGERAAQAAKMYYDSLFAGRADVFVAGHSNADDLPEKYKRERIDNAFMFVAEQEAEHRGVQSVRISRSEPIDSLQMCVVYLMFCYGDSTNEEVAVQMIKDNDQWMLR